MLFSLLLSRQRGAGLCGSPSACILFRFVVASCYSAETTDWHSAFPRVLDPAVVIPARFIPAILTLGPDYTSRASTFAWLARTSSSSRPMHPTDRSRVIMSRITASPVSASTQCAAWARCSTHDRQRLRLTRYSRSRSTSGAVAMSWQMSRLSIARRLGYLCRNLSRM